MGFDSKYKIGHQSRFSKTLNLIDKFTDKKEVSILDLGEENPFSAIMLENAYHVKNTPKGMDLDENIDWFSDNKVDMVTAFEIFEHLVNPFQVLKEIKANRLIATVPLSLWFAKAYRHPNNKWDQHFHEFEDWQFDMLLERTGWKVIHREKWKMYDNKIGFRPILRRFYPRIYAVVADRVD